MPAGSTPAATSASFAARTRSSTAANTFFVCISLDIRRNLCASRPRELAQFGSRVKETGVLLECIAVGHAGDEIGHAPRLPGFVARIEILQPFRRHAGGGAHEMVKQVAYHAFRIRHDAGDARMAIHAR